mmetsp:Transcript_17614/g.35076  ORF Transcript_17614/g.35076 Transcript_17614/m.35076 type:complete len:176 (+) Transcript_17614:81-608(+)
MNLRGDISSQPTNTARRRKKWAKSLGAYLHFLVDTTPSTTLLVELKSGLSYDGTLVDVNDNRGQMNLTLSDVVVVSSPPDFIHNTLDTHPETEKSDAKEELRHSREKQRTFFDMVHIRGSTIRYISFGGSSSVDGDPQRRRRGVVTDWSRAVRNGMSREENAKKKYARTKRKAST